MTQVFKLLAVWTALAFAGALPAAAQTGSLDDLLNKVRQDAQTEQSEEQEKPQESLPEENEGEAAPEPNLLPKITPEPETAPDPDAPEEESDIPAAPEVEIPVIEDEKRAKDLTIRSESDRERILSELFDNLLIQPDAESADLVAEEIWAVFLQSRSSTVDFLLLRGITAQKRGDLKLARRMYNHVLRLQPEYAEGWSRSGRLAVDERDLSRAVNDTAQSLVLEPRHFYALWTLGNILEKLGKQEEALEAYEEAAKLYPQHKEINERVEYLKADVQGKAL